MPKSYSEKLKDPRWQKKRLQILQRDKWVCQSCFSSNDGENRETLHVHHRWYDHGKEPWDYPDNCFLTVCKPCHDLIKDDLDWLKNLGRNESVSTIMAMVGCMKAIRAALGCDLAFQGWLWHRHKLIYGVSKSEELIRKEYEVEDERWLQVVKAKRQ